MELGDVDPDDTMQISMIEMQTANTMACYLLTVHGFHGHLLQTELKNKKAVDVGIVTVTYLKDSVEESEKASTYDSVFAVTEE